MDPRKQDDPLEGQKSPKGSGMGVHVAIALGVILIGFMSMGMPGMAVFYVETCRLADE